MASDSGYNRFLYLLISGDDTMGISFDEALSQLSAIHDEAALRAFIEQLDVTGNTSRVTVL